MKRPEILTDFQDLIGKEIVYYTEEYYDCTYYSIMFTKDNIFMFTLYSGMGDPYIDYESLDGINRLIIKYEGFRELLLKYSITDKEYIDKLFNEKEANEKKQEELKIKRKLDKYNKLKKELGID